MPIMPEPSVLVQDNDRESINPKVNGHIYLISTVNCLVCVLNFNSVNF